jgi:outer membrane protein assembly factor BamB
MSEFTEQAEHEARSDGPGPWRRSVGALVCLLALGAAQDYEQATRPRAFQLYDSLAARAVAESAIDHMVAGRWPEALVDLQRLLEEHRGEVLGATRPTAEGARHPSQGDVHLGASHWAERQLFGLPAVARKLYRERHEARAGEALERALALGDRGALSSVARRWPLTDASQRAWWALGDLEVERGETLDGLRAWARGAALLLGEPERAIADADAWRAVRDRLRAGVATVDGAPLAGGLAGGIPHAGALARVELALALFAGEGAGLGASADTRDIASFLDGVADTALIEPEGFGSEGWAEEWRVPRSSSANPFSDERAYMRVFGARDAGAVYVNTSRAVYAIGAFSGETLWTFGSEELGWDKVSLESARPYRTNADTTLSEFNKALDTTNHISAPAVARGIVVAALQLPIAYEKRDQFNRIEIIDVIPERRLVGLDARTGERIWDGFPPPGWDGDSGTLAERMTVVGPPTIVGSRVLVPLARQRGRIEKHVGCFDLGSGALLWSTPLVTGQVPLNMFGRQVREFSAPPVVVAGGTVLVQTNLGVVAAVDLFTGDTLWETVYEQIPIQAPTYYEEGMLRSKWRNAPPVVVGSAVVATPVDCPELIALDLSTGALRWSTGHHSLLQRRQNATVASEVLFGADERRVYLYVEGGEVRVFESPDGLERAAPTRLDWSSELADRASPRRVDIALPAMDSQYIYLPGNSSLTVLEREHGRVVREIPGDLGSGNLLVSNGALVAVSSENVTAAFEWRGMVTRAEAAVRAAPDDLRPVAELARLYLVRADALADDGNVAEAARLYGQARATLTARSGSGPGSGPGPGGGAATPRPFREPLFRAHVGLARLAQRALDHALAEGQLREALAVAPDDDRRREALLHLQGVQRRRPPRSDGAHPAGDFTETLARLATEFGSTELTVQFQPALGWAPGGVDGTSPDPWLGALVPEETRPPGNRRGGGDPDDAPGASARTTIALWAALELAAEDRRQGADKALAARLFDLLRRFGDDPLPGGSGVDVRTWATGRLGLLRATAAAEVFAPYEAEARALLEAARVDQGRGEGVAVGSADSRRAALELARIAALYPGTDAARRANDLRLDVAVATGQVEEVARIVLDPLPADSSIRTLDERQLRLLLRLAAALGAGGNPALRAGLAEQMATARPSLVADLEPYRGLGIGALAEVWREAAAPVPPSVPRPTTAVVPTERMAGDFAFVGSARAEDGGELALFLSQNGLVALRAGERTGYVWNVPLADVDWPSRVERTRVQGGLVHVAARDRIVCVRASDGGGGWTWHVGDGRSILRIVHSDGVALVRTVPEFGDGSELLVALDAASGVELWRRATPLGTIPVAGGGRLVLVLEGSDRAEVIDLFLGGRIRTLEVGNRRNVSGGEGWISEGLYVLPQFLRDDDPARNHVEAFDLETGARAWRIDFNTHRGAPHVLMSVLEHAPPGAEPQRLFVLRRSDAASSTRTVHVLNERLGALDRGALVELRERAQLVDMPPHGLVRLNQPLFFVETTPRDSGERASLRAVDVHLGTLWEVGLPRPPLPSGTAPEAGQSRLLTPVVGEDTVVFASVSSGGPRASGEAQWQLTFFDRRSGEVRETRPLPREIARWHELVGVGSALFLAGVERLDRFE